MPNLYRTYNKIKSLTTYILCRMSSLSNLIMLHVFADMYLGMMTTIITSMCLVSMLIMLLFYRLSYVKEDLQHYRKQNISLNYVFALAILKIKNIDKDKEFDYDDYIVRMIHILLTYFDYVICMSTYLGICYLSYFIQTRFLDSE